MFMLWMCVLSVFEVSVKYYYVLLALKTYCDPTYLGYKTNTRLVHILNASENPPGKFYSVFLNLFLSLCILINSPDNI